MITFLSFKGEALITKGTPSKSRFCNSCLISSTAGILDFDAISSERFYPYKRVGTVLRRTDASKQVEILSDHFFELQRGGTDH